MARTGKFGRTPRVAQSLTNTLVAIAREFQQQRDANLMSAWQKGGTFEGQKATDELVLKYWNDRMAGVSKDDPLHDTYQQSHDQLDYSIHESKMTAAYALHKASDSQMISFYLGWAKKVPKDSEFYRVLQRDAGQYMRVARANGAAAAAKAKEEQYQKLQADTRQGKEAAGEYMIDTLRRVAQSGYAEGGVSALIGEPGSGSDLTDFDPSDPGQMLRLLRAITTGSGTKSLGPQSGTANTLYHNDDGKAVTGADIMAQLAKLDPSLQSGQAIDVSYITGLLDRQVQGLDERIDRANKTGHLTDAANLQKSKTYVATLNREVGSWPVQKSYTELRQTFDSVANDPTASPAAVLKAWGDYRNGLIGLADSPGVAANDNLRSRIMGEANGDTGAPTLAESFTGLQNGAFDPASAKDAANTKAHMEFLQQQVESVQKGEAVWTQGVTGSDGVFVPQAGGKEIGAATPQQVDAGGANVQQITVADPRGGSPIQMLVTAVPVYATATDPTKGTALHPLNANPVAYAYDIAKGGTTQTIYGFQTKDQGFVFSADPPWDERLHATNSSTGGNHIELDLTPVVARMQGNGDINLAQNRDLGNGFSVDGATASGGGTLVFDPLAATTSTSTRNATGSADPTSDFHSLTLTYLIADSEGRSVLNNLDKNAPFKAQLDNDAAIYAGMQQDPKTGAWMPGTGDPNKLAQAQLQDTLASNATNILGGVGSFLSEAQKLWQRATTGSPFSGGINASQPQQNGAFGPAGGVAKLATDLLSGTPFAALGAAFNPGTNQIKAAPTLVGDAIQIKPIGTLQVPTYTPPPAPQVVSGPIASPTSVQSGSVAPTTTATQTSSQTGSTAPAPAAYGPRPV